MSDIITSGYTNVDQVIIDLIIIIKILLNAASESDMIFTAKHKYNVNLMVINLGFGLLYQT